MFVAGICGMLGSILKPGVAQTYNGPIFIIIFIN